MSVAYDTTTATLLQIYGIYQTFCNRDDAAYNVFYLLYKEYTEACEELKRRPNTTGCKLLCISILEDLREYVVRCLKNKIFEEKKEEHQDMPDKLQTCIRFVPGQHSFEDYLFYPKEIIKTPQEFEKYQFKMSLMFLNYSLLNSDTKK